MSDIPGFSGISDIGIALVGAGPRGTSVLERLCASAPELLRPGTRLTVHVIDPAPPGPGRVWRTAQSPHLLMNTVASQVTLFTDESVDCSGPIRPGPSLYEWASGESGGADGPGQLGPDDYPTRAQYGRYLEWVFAEVVRGAPPEIRVEVHGTRAVRLDDAPDGAQRLTLATGRVLTRLAAVVLAQGHLPTVPDRAERDLTAYAARHGLRHFPPANPADLDLSPVAPGEPVLLRGLGLNFFDHMALLTTGRGGRFVHDDGDDRDDRSREKRRLRYVPSGREPRLYAGSRRGVPYQARGDNAKGPYGRHTPLVLTPEVIAGLRKRSDSGEAPDFLAEIWPLVAKEVETVYYEGVLGASDSATCRDPRNDCRSDPRSDSRSDSGSDSRSDSGSASGSDSQGGPRGRTRGDMPHQSLHGPSCELLDAPCDGPADDASRRAFRDRFLAAPHRSAQEAAVLDEFGVAEAERWSWGRVSRPYTGREFAGPEDWRGWLLGYLREDAAQAALGNVEGPVKAALDVLRDLRNELRLIVDHGGLAGASRREHLDRWYTPLNAFLSIGPPRSRIEEMSALIEAGVLTVLGPRLEVRPEDGTWLAHSPDVPGSAVRVTTVVEARLPEPDLRRTADELLAGLLRTGGCRPHRVDGYETGGLDVTPRPYRLINRQGAAHPRRFAFGVPTEGVHWVTAAGARPGVDSVTLSDADAVARAVLRATTYEKAASAEMKSWPEVELASID
ncbi:FAD/NAD(P)-binding protein [Streptomyces sp. CA-210063]|uniref:FAD/NAD(P)-binding protein n=1 Tax=Streptomyces sp. CA-210063 TaxID=2801029 RepID=UPI00214BC456|nr:FAD/NAD(P)-binding protein [Streptomyces sp. CA-210063]UUU34270.1 FAD/NAD(P)-binding protein [Streptomyces sp. CA-210063]